MALIRWKDATAAKEAAAQAEQPPSDEAMPTPGFGNPTTLLLLLVAAAFLWWNMRRRRQFEERLREQRRAEAVTHAEQSAMNVAHIMRAAPSRDAAEAAASEGLASAASTAVWPPAGQTGAAGAAEGDRASAAARADRVAAEQAERAAHGAGQAPGDGEGGRGTDDASERIALRDAAATAHEAEQIARDDAAVVAEARANQAQPYLAGDVPGATVTGAPDPDAAEALRAGLQELESEAEVPLGAVAGDGTPTCPPEFPIKGNAQSMIYHLPEQTSYPPTIAEYCFASAEAAEAAGFRRSRAAARARD